MFALAMLGGAVALGLAINAADQVADGGLGLLQAARHDGAVEGINRYREGIGQKKVKEAFEAGYKACRKDVKEILGR
jgi:hypothetical protein